MNLLHVVLVALAPVQAGSAQADSAQEQLLAPLREAGIALDLEAGVLSIPATVLVRNDLLEYLLVAPNGAAHESLFGTPVRPSLLNAALLLLGVEAGSNARFEVHEELDDRGRPLRSVHPPAGDGFYLYAGWREEQELFFYRIEDLVRNLQSSRSLRRHRWVYLGSRFQALKPGAPEAFMADVEGNLINLTFFFQGNTLLTAAPEECLGQTIWAANEWLLPPLGEPLRIFFARKPLALLPSGFELPQAEREPERETELEAEAEAQAGEQR